MSKIGLSLTVVFSTGHSKATPAKFFFICAPVVSYAVFFFVLFFSSLVTFFFCLLVPGEDCAL